MKTFVGDLNRFPKLVRVDSEEGRVYQTPTGKAYPSVTSVTGLKTAKYIKEWRDRIGHEAATQITTKASKRGTAIHSLCEKYLLGEEVKPNINDLEMFGSMKLHLDKIDNIHCLETQLYSHHLEVAGTVDTIAEYEGKLAVIDYKTSRKPKDKSSIEGYFLQASAYSVMFEEITGISVPRLLIIMGVDDHEPLVFKEHRDNWIEGFKTLRADYKKIKGI